jgi:hypothetical protein
MNIELLKASAIQGVQGKWAEPYFCYGEAYFLQDNEEVCRFQKFKLA